MVESNGPNSNGLLGEIDDFLRRRKQQTNSLITQFLAEQVFTEKFDLSKDARVLGTEIASLYPVWKDLLLRWGVSTEMSIDKKEILGDLTLKDVASFSEETFQHYKDKLANTLPDSPEEQKARKQVDIWSKVAESTQMAVELEQK